MEQTFTTTTTTTTTAAIPIAGGSCPVVVTSPQAEHKDCIGAPKELHCFRCKSKQPLKDVEIKITNFRSARKGIPMNRESWVAKCATCGAVVRSFKAH